MLGFQSQNSFFFRMHADLEYKKVLESVDRLNSSLSFPQAADEIRTDEYDLFLPTIRSGQERIIVNIHGGLPVMGSKDLNRHFNARMAAEGVLVISLEYPKLTEATLQEQLRAVKQHLEHAWVQVQAMTTQKHIYLTGDTYGALLGFYTAAVQKEHRVAKKLGVEPVIPPIHAMGFISGLFDTTSSDAIGKRLSHILWGRDAMKKYGNLTDPAYIVGFGTMPPIYLTVSGEEPLRPYSEALARACQDAELTYEFCVSDRKDGVPAFQIIDPAGEDAERTIRDMLNFFESA